MTDKEKLLKKHEYNCRYRAEHRDQLNAYRKSWGKRNKDKISEYNRKYENDHRDARNAKRREYAKAWRKRQKEIAET